MANIYKHMANVAIRDKDICLYMLMSHVFIVYIC